MNTPHKHCEVIKAWAEGKTVQIKQECTWLDITEENPFWSERAEFRIKPETIKYRIGLFKSLDFFTLCVGTQAKQYESNYMFIRWLTDWVEVEI